MVARESIEQYRIASAQLSSLVAEELAAYFGVLDLSHPAAVRDALLEFVPLLVAEYGQAAAALAVEWYEQLRFESGAAGSYRAALPPVPSVTPGRVEAKVRFLAGKLWTPEPTEMLSNLTIATDKYVKQPGRDAIAWNADREGVLWARVPSGAKTCAWCLILASRDAVYLSEQSAETKYDGEAYHGFCDCQAVPLHGGDDYPEGYLPGDFYDMYTIARDAAGSGDMKDIAAAMRREFPDVVTDGAHTH